MKRNSEIHSYVVSQKSEMTNVLKELIKIPSVRGEKCENAPFGEECKNALEFIKKLYKENGFESTLDYDGGYLVSNYGNGTKSIGLFAHTDVVAAGDGWQFTTPFSPIEKDGFIVGRGALDNKSAVLVSLCIMKAIRDLRLPIKSKIVSFIGSCEETGMSDIDNYLKKNIPPDFALVPDTCFPVYRGDKGRMLITATSRLCLTDIADFCGGESANAIVGRAQAKLKKSVKTYLEKNRSEKTEVKIDGEEILLTANGISKHASLPEGSLNAGYIISKLLADCDALCENDRKIMKTLSLWLNDNYGEVFGINCENEDFGKLTCANGMISTNDGKVSVTFDIRYGNSTDANTIKSKMKKVIEESGFEFTVNSSRPPFAIEKDDKFVQAIMDTYKEFTGEKEAVPYINGGGTYACKLPYALEVGSFLHNDAPFPIPDGHGRVHQPDEMIRIDGMLDAIELIIEILLHCDKILNG